MKGDEGKKVKLKFDFEKLMASISTDFVSFKNIEGSIKNALKVIGEFTGASRAYFFEIDNSGRTMTNTYEWCDIGIEPEIENLIALPISMFPWWISELKKDRVINIADVSQMGEEAEAEKEILEVQGIKSVLVLPVFVQNQLYGFIGFDNVSETGIWPHEDLTLLKLTAEIFSNAFERLEAENELRKSNEELKIALEKLKIAQAQIVQQEQMAAVGQLAAGIAHEVNNPLGYIISNVETLRENGKLLMNYNILYQKLKIEVENNADISEIESAIKRINEYEEKIDIYELTTDIGDSLDDIDQGLEKVAKIVNGLRFFSRVDKGEDYSVYNINEGLENTLIVVENKLKYSVNVKKELGHVPNIFCVGSQINQVILNIVLNSIYAIREKYGEEKGNIHLKTYHDEAFIYCTIEDDGIGISKSHLSNIFNAFFTTKPVGVGTGLGLNIAYNIIVTKHNGEIRVESEEGMWTKFTIVLPITEVKLDLDE